MTPLPIDAVLTELLTKLKMSGAVVLRAPTGAGKTTRVPPALILDKQILLLEPRRVAARAAARRMAIESDTLLGEWFGYHVRFDKKCSPRTRVVAVTPGILLRYLQDDPFLESIGTVIFDEFHERGLESELALGLVRLLRQTVRPDLKAIVMSATLDVERIAKYLGDCPIVISEGRSFPVKISYRSRRAEMPILDAATSAVRDVLSESTGDVLVFLPGLGEIRRLEEALGDLQNECEILPLHGELPPEQQDRALQKLNRRKIVLATNVAETSVTVEGVTAVIDTGQARQLEFDAGVGMNRLKLVPISKSSADQRAGRAGRTEPGICIRLWDEPGHAARLAGIEPEIRRADLAPAILHLLSLGEKEIEKFPWLDPPRPEAVQSATQLLELLGAVKNQALTELGRQMVALPVHPRIARMLLADSSPATALAAAILSDRDPFDRGTLTNAVPTHSDLLDRVEALEEFERSGRTRFSNGELHRGGARQTLKARDQLLRLLPEKRGFREEPFLQAIFAAYPDRLCRRRERNDRRALMVGGRGVKLAPQSGVSEPDLFVAVDVDAGGNESVVRIASEVKREWLTTATAHELEFDTVGEKVVAWKRSRFNGLVIDESSGHIADEAAAENLLADAARGKIVPEADSAAGRFLVRLACLRQWRPDFDLPMPAIEELLPAMCRGCRSFADLRRADWMNAIRDSFTFQQWQLIEREAPEAIRVPSGREVALAYELGRPPVLAAKIQELFGMRETPRVAGGTVKVLIHLLAPNGRPQQVTDDLANFWANTYRQVRKDLRGRYPKHDWPEDPATAVASRGVRRN